MMDSMKKPAVIAWLFLIFSLISGLFWRYDWIYAQPTPIPKNYKVINPGDPVALPRSMAGTKPVFLHFFNPDCPCSKFNIPLFESLVRSYGGQVDFAIVLVTDQKYSEKEIRDRFGLTVPVFTDTAIAAACGVYSTPQAVLLTAGHTLFYRGNYNRSRYCADARTSYAAMALNALLHKTSVVFDQMALRSYGCPLPGCSKKIVEMQNDRNTK
jgi:hypothetical protein